VVSIIRDIAEQDDDTYLRKVIYAGARGVVRTDFPVSEIVQAVRDIAAGHAVLPPNLTGALLAEAMTYWAPRTPTVPAPARPEYVQTLTERELRVLRLIAHGMVDSEIGALLRISVATVRSHVHHILTKLNLRARAQAVAYIYRYGLAGRIATQRRVDSTAAIAQRVDGIGRNGSTKVEPRDKQPTDECSCLSRIS
jgi:DNA-binding NarL/FixJ family response regulator